MSQPDRTLSLEMQALAALRKMRAKLEALERRRSEPLAIIGIGCRVPGGVTDTESYWDLLQNGRHAVRKVPPDRWDPDKYFDPDPRAPGKTYTCWGGFIDGIDQFDAPFFGIAAAEARRMSPPQRLFLEVAWEALEAAGISPKSLSGTRTGVFVGATTNDYLQLQTKVQSDEDIDAYVATNNTLNVIAGRVSYTLGLQGPSMAIDTACSSSLVAIDRACRSLRDGEIDLVITGGVNVNITPDTFISASKWGMLARDGRCKVFDAAADGFVRGEGCGVLIIKRLSDARAAGDRILAVVRGTAVNQDGPSSGLSVPNGLAQESVIKEALANAGVEPQEVSYVEAHGTGTSLGDPIEVEALGRALAERDKRTAPLLIGSVKTNLGHLEAAAGVAGLIKVVLSLQHRAIPPHLHLQKPSEQIAWEQYAIEVPTQLRRWEAINGRRIAGVSSFGFSGTNAHMVLEEAPAVASAEARLERPYHLLSISAKTSEGLTEQVKAYRARLQGKDEDRLADLCYTANVGRAHFGQRLIVEGQTREELALKLGTGEGVVRGEVGAQQKPRVAMLFTGQGSQYVGMGRILYETSPLFRSVLERCDELLRGKLPQGLLEVMFGTGEGLLDQTRYTQPALFALEYGLAELWRSWGVQPTAVLGHSVGEYVAACVAGVYSLEDGLNLIAERGQMMQAEPAGGAMAAIFASQERVRAAVAGHEFVSIAAVNGPNNVVISGDQTELAAIREQLASSGVKSRPLRVSHAFHSRRMDPVLEQLEAAAGQVQMQTPQLRLISNLTGRVAGAEVTKPQYWARHTREAVQFARGIETLRELSCGVMLEVGPAAILIEMGQECLGGERRQWLSSLQKGKEEWQQMSASVQALYAAGTEIDWAGWDAGYGRRKVSMPTYQFQRQRCWIGATEKQPTDNKRIETVQSANASIEDLYEIAWRPAAKQPGTERPAKDSRWLIFADQAGMGLALATVLESQRQRCVIVQPESSAGDFEKIRQVVRGAIADAALHGVVYLPGVDTPDPRHMTTEALTEFEQRVCSLVLHVVQAIAAEHSSYVPRLWLVTRGAQGGVSDVHPCGLAAASILGLGKAIAIEHPELRCTRIDLDPAEHVDDGQLLFEEIWCPDREDEVAFRQGTRFIPRLVRRSVPTRPASNDTADQPLQLEIQQPGLLESLKLRPIARRAPGTGEVEIRVRAMGLNFRDVLTALRMCPGSDLALGGECAGTIERVGAGVENWKPGDEVTALSPGKFSRFAVTRAELAALKPTGMNWTAAASVPVAFLMAVYGLQRLAKLAKGQSILIHAATGGVGLAAVQLAQLAGAEIYATAGSEEKRGHLRSLGVQHVMDSRSLDFVHQIRHSTGGRGVDVVLNSLSGDFIREGLAIVDRDGCFLELGKRGILRPEEAASLRPDVRYYAYDLNEVFLAQPNLVQEMFGELVSAFESGTLRPLPVTTFPLGAARHAFRYMANAKHIGKIVLLPPPPAPTIREGTYLVTGGLGVLGLQVARWLVAGGARQLVLLSRSTPTESQREVVEQLRASGAKVACLVGDVASPEQTRKILEEISESMPSLRGIVHAAGIVDNHTLATLDGDACARVFAAKVRGAWNLHQQTLGCELDFFVLFSSAAVILGASGQANYMGANAFLNSFSHYRHAQGLPAMAVDWGCWAETNNSEFPQDTAVRPEAFGRMPLASAEALKVFELLFASDVPHLAFMRMNWQTFLRAPYDSPFFDEVRPRNIPVQAPADDPPQSPKKPAATQSRATLERAVREVVARVLGINKPESIDPDMALLQMGVDSLIAVELRTRLEAVVGKRLRPALIFQYPTITALVDYLANETLGKFSTSCEPADVVRVAPPSMTIAGAAGYPTGVDALSDAEVDRLLRERPAGKVAL
jgi:acyl transferase domain-containing protein/NAD(P)-dependent dehydrogenase (short-subunit alcohol dehydrogenase family)/acyl carrier protein